MELTIDNIKEGWKQGDYTAVGYLYHLALVSDIEGWPLTTVHCSEDERAAVLEISRDEFISARQKLIEAGRAIQDSSGKIDFLWP